MANIPFNTGTGLAYLHADEITSGVFAQRGKLTFGPEGTATDVTLSSPLFVKPVFTSSGNQLITTSSSGASWITLPNQACTQYLLVNVSAVTIELRQDSSTESLLIMAGGIIPLYGLTNTNQLKVRRHDQSSSQVTFSGRWEG